MTIHDEILNLPLEELEKMSLLSKLELDIAQKEHWGEQRKQWKIIVILAVVAQVTAFVAVMLK